MSRLFTDRRLKFSCGNAKITDELEPPLPGPQAHLASDTWMALPGGPDADEATQPVSYPSFLQLVNRGPGSGWPWTGLRPVRGQREFHTCLLLLRAELSSCRRPTGRPPKGPGALVLPSRVCRGHRSPHSGLAAGGGAGHRRVQGGAGTLHPIPHLSSSRALRNVDPPFGSPPWLLGDGAQCGCCRGFLQNVGHPREKGRRRETESNTELWGGGG